MLLHRPFALLDTCVVSAFVKGEMQPSEAAAFQVLLEHQVAGRISFLASTVSHEEILAIPLSYQSSHLRQYEALANIRSLVPTESDNRDNQALRALLRDENDARFLTQCQKSGVGVFLTLDAKTVLNKAAQIQAVCGVRAQTPNEYLCTTFGSA